MSCSCMHYIRLANMLTGADVGGHGGRPPGPIGGRGPPGGGPPLIGPPGPYMCGGGGPLEINKSWAGVARIHFSNVSVANISTHPGTMCGGGPGGPRGGVMRGPSPGGRLGSRPEGRIGWPGCCNIQQCNFVIYLYCQNDNQVTYMGHSID